MTDTNRKILAALLASLMMMSMVGAAVAPAAVGAAGPSGMVALGNAQISEDVPAGESVPIGADDLEGAVYASDHADTLEVVVTTPERASEYLENGTVVSNEEVVLVLRDDEVHDGRDVAIDLALLEDAVGYAPEVAYGTHDSGEEWQSPIEREGTNGIFHVPEFSSNSVTFSGGITLSGDAASDGTTYQYKLDNLDGVDNFAINLTGVSQTANLTESGSTTGEETLDLGGTEPPESAEFTVNIPSTRTWGDTGENSKSITLGDDAPTGTYQVGWDLRDSGSSLNADILVNGNVEATVSVGGKYNDFQDEYYARDTYEEYSRRTVTAGAGDTITIESTEEEYEFNGVWRTESTSSNTTVETGGGDSLTISDGGTKAITLSNTTPTLTVTNEGDPFNSWAVDYTARTNTRDPVVEVNGYETSYSGTLADGETTSLATNEGWLQNGTNTVTINTTSPATGPESLVGFEYAHDASGTTQSVDVEATSWTEAFNVSNTFPSAVTGADATLTFNEDVAEIDGVEYRTSGGEWMSPPGYELNGTDLEVELGDISADTTVDVRATGYKINTYDGEIDILSPTVEGDELATEVEVTSLLEGGMFGIRVDGTAVGDRIHYASDYSWSGEPAHVDVTSSGTQILRSSDVNVGSTMTVSSSPISVTPESGAVEVVVEDATEPRFKIRQGDTVGASSVEVTYHDTLDGERYVLYSETENRQIDAARANSPVTFTTDGDTETYTVRQVDREGAVGGGAPPERNGGSTAPLVLVVPAVGLSVFLLFFAGRRFGGATGLRGNAVLIGASTVVSVTALELVTPGSLISQVYRATVFALGDAAASGLGAVLAAIATIVGLWQLQQRTRADVPIWVTIPSVSLAAVLALESIRPGSVLGALEGVIAEVGALLALLAVAGIFYWWRNRNQVEKAEASTPDTQVTLDLGDQGGND